MAKYTPMIEQYLEVKAQYSDAFLFFRLGDFYELFFDDAIKASQELEITLTGRDGGAAEKIPMCGVPYHAAKDYIAPLIEKGYKVAICEQVEDPKQAKGVVKREVIQLITPGTVMDGKLLHDRENNFIASVTEDKQGHYGLIAADLSTGESRITRLDSFDDVLVELISYHTKEVIVSPDFDEQKRKQMKERSSVIFSEVKEDVVPDSLKELAPFDDSLLLQTSGRLFSYLVQTQKRSLEHLQKVYYYEVEHFMKLDLHARRNLELTETIRHKGRTGSLLWLLDRTMTAMGARMLKQWIERPLLLERDIQKRFDMVETFIHEFIARNELKEQLKQVYDLERLVGRVAFGNVNARDLVQLRRTLEAIPFIRDVVCSLENETAKEMAKNMDPCSELCDLLRRGIVDQPPLSVKEGGMIRDGFNEKLDMYRHVTKNGKSWIAELEQKEREQTGIKSLKVGYNRVFGYYIEITKANLHLLKEGRYERKQTLANAERFITQELKEKEALILEAEEKIIDLEYDIFQTIRHEIKPFIPRLQRLAKLISELDVLQCFATVSEEHRYIRPQFSTDGTLSIVEGRHPVVEKVMNDKEYVANDVQMNEDRTILLITGPNMSGKSTYMRQVALTSIMAQIGCFVPCEKATLPIFDQIFTRIGAADDLVSGQSTFMVEMIETNDALQKATNHSLILLDEIGRGTSTYDGMALAQAIIEYIAEHVGAKTLFSTHYHELTVLADEISTLTNVHVRAIEENQSIVFLHKVQEGPADRSYGIHVAKLAELPDELIKRADAILKTLESGQATPIIDKSQTCSQNEQLSFFEEKKEVKQEKEPLDLNEKAVTLELKQLNLLDMTPLDALNALYRLQKQLKK